MRLSTLAKLNLLGLAYIYTARLVDTLHHGIFRPSALAMTVVGFNILVGLAQLLFFVALYRQFIPRDQQVLRNAGWLAIIGAAIGILPKLLAFDLLMPHQTPSALVIYGAQIKAFCPFLTSLLLFVFSCYFS